MGTRGIPIIPTYASLKSIGKLQQSPSTYPAIFFLAEGQRGKSSAPDEMGHKA
jgi:hypothetical protein